MPDMVLVRSERRLRPWRAISAAIIMGAFHSAIVHARAQAELPAPSGRLFVNVFRQSPDSDATIVGVGMLDIATRTWTQACGENLKNARVSPDAQWIASCSINEGVCVFRVGQGSDMGRVFEDERRSYTTDRLFWSSGSRQVLCDQTRLPPESPSHHRATLLDIESGKRTALPLPDRVTVSDWSPDGKTVLVDSLDIPEDPAKLWHPRPIDIMNIDGSGRRRLLDDSRTANMHFDQCQFSPDGGSVFFIKDDLAKRSRTLWSISLDGGDLRCIVPEQEEQVAEYRISPDRKYFAVRLATPLPAANANGQRRAAMHRLAVFDADGELKRSIVFPNHGFEILDWRDGSITHHPVRSDGRLFIHAFNKPSALQHLNGLDVLDIHSRTWFRVPGVDAKMIFGRVSPDGTRLAYYRPPTIGAEPKGPDETGTWVLDLDGKGERRRLGGKLGLRPEWSTDGKRILLSTLIEPSAGRFRTWLFDLEGQHKNLLALPDSDEVRCWLPDNRRVIVAAGNTPESLGKSPSQWPLHVVNIDGTRRTSLLSGENASGIVTNIRVTRDGKRAFISRFHPEKRLTRIWSLDLSSGKAQQVIKAQEFRYAVAFCLSPNGNSIAVVFANHSLGQEHNRDMEAIQYELVVFDANGQNGESIPTPHTQFTVLDWVPPGEAR